MATANFTPESYEIGGENNLQNKLTSINNLAVSYEMRLRGFKTTTNGEKWVIQGGAVIGEAYIVATSAIIADFAHPANLITTKSVETFMQQYEDAFRRVNTFLVNDESLKGNTALRYRTAIKIFKDTMINIGDILTGSRELTKKAFERYDEEQPRLNSFD